MRTCDACGFENAEPGRRCALCGASEIVLATSDLSTIAAPAHAHAGLGRWGGCGAVEAGHVFGERYRVLSLLGSGGMGQVFRVEDATSGEALALKVLGRSTLTTPTASGASSARSRSSRASGTRRSSTSSTGVTAPPGSTS